MRQALKQQREAIFQSEVFAVAGGVLANEGELAPSRFDQALCFGDHRLEMSGTELATQLRDDAEAARMIAAFRDLDVGRVPGRGQDARRCFRVKIMRQVGDRAVPLPLAEASAALACFAFWTRMRM